MSLGFEATFDGAAEAYERVRPAYPAAIFRDILRYQPLNAESRVLEIGMGTGRATGPFLETGCRLVGIEPGGNLLKAAVKRFGGYANFSAFPGRLQDYACPDERFDLVCAATSFHWIPEAYGYRRVYGLLRKGGAFARFRYHAGPDRKRRALTEEIRALYRECMPEKPEGFTEADAAAIAGTAEKYGFRETGYRLYHTEKDFTADEYLALLGTYPDHVKLEEPKRSRLLDGIQSAIARNGGVITVSYTMDLELARKPAG